MNILFICTHNRCRSILAEAVFQQQSEQSGAELNICSAGSQPAGHIHPESLAALKRHNIPHGALSSQSWNDFQQSPWDLVITVCDSAANEACPSYLSSSLRLHWPLEDPSSLNNGATERQRAFDFLIQTLQNTAGSFTRALEQGNKQAALDSLKNAGAIAV